MKTVTFATLKRFLRLSAHLQMLPILEGGEETLIGGQAVMEGVMMLAPHSAASPSASPTAGSSPMSTR